jgi:hypothetical protein
MVLCSLPAASAGFSSAADPSALSCLTLPTSVGSCAASGAALELAWTNGDVAETRDGGAVYHFGALDLEIRPRFSFDGDDTVVAKLEFGGRIQFPATASRFSIMQNNVGTFSAMVLFVQAEQRLKFTLPSMFTSVSSGEKSYGILAFGCDAALEQCDSPLLVFHGVLQRYGATPIGFPGNQTAGLVGPRRSSEVKLAALVRNEETEAARQSILTPICVDHWVGRCKCVCSGAICPPLCEQFVEGACNDCQLAFLCNC